MQDVIGDIDDAKVVWETLKNIFEPVSRAREARLRQEFFSLHLENNEPMAIFLARVDRKAQELADIKAPRTDKEIAFQYLNKLPEEYEHTVQQVYHWSDADFIPSKVRAQLLAEYSRLKMKQPTASASNIMASDDPETAKAFAIFQKGYSASQGKQQTPSRGASTSRACFNCGQNHFVRDCPHLPNRGSPASVKTPDSRGSAKRGRGRGRRGNKPRSNEQFGSFVASIDHEPIQLVSANDVGLSAPSGDSKDVNWYLDTGATNHICTDRTWFADLAPVKDRVVSLGEGASKIVGVGNVTIQVKNDTNLSTITLKDVLYIPTFCKNLISVGSIDKAQYHIDIYQGVMSIYLNNAKQCLLYGERLTNRLYSVCNVMPCNVRDKSMMSTHAKDGQVSYGLPCANESSDKGSHVRGSKVIKTKVSKPFC